MPHADYRCGYCGTVYEDHVFAMAVGARASAPRCEYCHRVMDVIPAFHTDLRTDGGTGSSFQKFSIARQVPSKDGLIQVREEVDSLHKLRQIERDSEQRYKDGEGEPLRFRAAHQNRSNLDANSFGESGSIGDRTYDSGQAPQKKANISTTRHGAKKPKVTLGPGVSRASTPLKG